MTGLGHRLTGPAAAMIAGALAVMAAWEPRLQVAAAGIALCTTRLPDTLELRNRFTGRSLISHRTITHWGLGWVAAAAFAMAHDSIPAAALLGASIGSLVHLLGDAPNPMGVPWIFPWRRVRLGQRGLWRSGQHEVSMVVAFSTVGFLAWWAANKLAYNIDILRL